MSICLKNTADSGHYILHSKTYMSSITNTIAPMMPYPSITIIVCLIMSQINLADVR